MAKILFSPEARRDLAENAVHIDRILYGRRDYLSVLFGEEFSDEMDN